MKIAVCVHLYHIDMIDSITSYLTNMEYDYDLFISLVKPYPQSFLNRLKKINKNTEIVYVKNIGVDVGGFLQVYKKIKNSYDLILKIHTKKGLGSEKSPSNYLKKHGLEDSIKRGQNWFNRSMNGVLGDKNRVKNIIKEFETNPNCGMIGAKTHNNFDSNKNHMEFIFSLMNLKVDYTNHHFIGGTIFWVKNSIFKKYLTDDVIDKILNKSPEGYAYEPSINHAMERVFGCLVYIENNKISIIK